MELCLLPDDCLVHIFSFTSPLDACRSCLVSSSVRSIAEFDAIWEKFLPPNYQNIIFGLVSQFEFSSKKDLFFKLCDPLLIDEGNMIFSLEKSSGKKSYILSARKLAITWASVPLYWSWKPLVESRFRETAELITTWWLEIKGEINTQMLSANTTYEAYLIVKFANRAYGLDFIPSEVSVEVGSYKTRATLYLRPNKIKKINLERACILNGAEMLRARVVKGEERVVRELENGWVEICLGEFYNGGGGGNEEVKMSLKEVKGEHLKGGLIVEGIEVRPKK